MESTREKKETEAKEELDGRSDEKARSRRRTTSIKVDRCIDLAYSISLRTNTRVCNHLLTGEYKENKGNTRRKIEIQGEQWKGNESKVNSRRKGEQGD
ncbi:hypothetical protein ANN_16603 [Periplaneta americana]|uniref:Uncharacterized protein n=1 Tax=Periplaneta americana TaxID=6978 RepID=A0ABQ8SQV1_PERAM|nr:hypothetical protein ANN_16603 [Periplaneta americana]